MELENIHGKKKIIIPIILAGGSGTRLWPLSRKQCPKALLKLRDGRTLLQHVYTQIQPISYLSTPIVVSNAEYGAVIAKHLKAIKAKVTLLLEKEPHNTAMAVAIAAQYILKKGDDPLLLVLPIDQYISNLSSFSKMIKEAAKIAIKRKLIVFGVKPHSPVVDYGYIKRGAKLPRSAGYLVKHFKEKPHSKNAVTYFKSGEYYWNSGTFLFLASTFFEELAQYAPKVFSASQKVVNTMKRVEKYIFHCNARLIKRYTNVSIDTAILEKTKRAVVFPYKGGWYDLGNWNALYSVAKKDAQGNVATHHVLSFDTQNSYLYTQNQWLVTAGVNDLLVVVTDDVVLVARRHEAQDIKKIVNYLKRHYLRRLI